MKALHPLSLGFALSFLASGVSARTAPDDPAPPTPETVVKMEAHADSWRAGAAQVRITPERPMWMTGFADRTHPATGTAQNLWAKALAIEDPTGRQAVLITLDLCGIPRALSDRVAEELEERHNIPRSAVIVNVSHTHSGPAVEGFAVTLLNLSDSDWSDVVAYRQDLELRMIRVAEEALSRLAPATLSWGVDSADFAVNRRNNVEKEVPELRAAAKLLGPVDFDVPVLAAHSRDGALLAVMVSYSCHNTTLTGRNYEWSGDYAGYAQAEIQRRHPGAVALFMQGCAGNINALPRGKPEAENYGRRLADAADRQLARPMHLIRGDFSSALEDISLPFAHRPTAEELKKASESKSPADRNWASYLLGELKHGGEIPMSHGYPVQAWRLGDLSLITLGGEAVVDYELRLQRECRPPVWVFGYSNDVMAYIPSESVLGEDASGGHRAGTHMGYEGKDSMLFYGRASAWAPGLEDKIISAAHRVLESVQIR